MFWRSETQKSDCVRDIEVISGYVDRGNYAMAIELMRIRDQTLRGQYSVSNISVFLSTLKLNVSAVVTRHAEEEGAVRGDHEEAQGWFGQERHRQRVGERVLGERVFR